ncbi:CidA/LrgA family protein [Bartonella tamiae]|uniref:CidA/LrgA family protein n=1 Tax=Bartonella tamiae Th239 TaxID=1094558 RepID=J1JWJ5_9HYPH|nr:CidA/LrgA family protein [Bartonella tamiae]EJF89387.1 hypothetical protein ME5_01938 [Bartonella tamiae Th239]EJF92748.1 hypothetical protein MEG_01918 [Bartonella tamiae Th307]
MLNKLTHQTQAFLHHYMLAQMAVIGVFWLLGESISRLFVLPIPGGIIGMGIVLLLLASGKLSLSSMKRGAEWLLAEMLLFFVPAVLALLNHKELIGFLGIKILVVILGGTLIVMSITALTIDLCYRWMIHHDGQN